MAGFDALTGVDGPGADAALVPGGGQFGSGLFVGPSDGDPLNAGIVDLSGSRFITGADPSFTAEFWYNASIPSATPATFTSVPATHPQLTDGANKVAVTPDGRQAILAMGGPTSTDLFSVPLPAGGPATLLMTVNIGTNKLLREPEGTYLVGGVAAGQEALARVNLATGAVMFFPQFTRSSWFVGGLGIDPVTNDLLIAMGENKIKDIDDLAHTLADQPFLVVASEDQREIHFQLLHIHPALLRASIADPVDPFSAIDSQREGARVPQPSRPAE